MEWFLSSFSSPFIAFIPGKNKDGVGLRMVFVRRLTPSLFLPGMKAMNGDEKQDDGNSLPPYLLPRHQHEGTGQIVADISGDHH